MKCCIFSGYLLSVKVNYLQTKEYNIFLKNTTCQRRDIFTMDLPKFIVSSQKEDSITIKRVKLRLGP